MADLYDNAGSLVSGTLQAILARKKEEQRQAMLDKLQMDKFQADQANEQQRITQGNRGLELEAERNTLQRSGQEQQAQESLERIFAQRAQNLPFDPSTVDVNSLDPKFAEYLEKTGGLAKETGPDGSVSRRYTGGPKWQETQTAQRELEKIFSSPSFTEGDDTMRQALMARAIPYGFTPPASAFEPTEEIRTISPRGVVTTHPGQRTRGNSVFQQDDPPNPPAGSYQNFQYTGTTDSGQPVVIGSRPGADGNPVIQVVQVPGGGRINAKPTNPDQPTDRLTQAITELGRSFTATGPDREARINTAKSALATAVPMSPDATNFAVAATTRIMERAASGQPLPTVDQVMTDAQKYHPNLNPQDRTNLIRVISATIQVAGQGR